MLRIHCGPITRELRSLTRVESEELNFFVRFLSFQAVNSVWPGMATVFILLILRLDPQQTPQVQWVCMLVYVTRINTTCKVKPNPQITQENQFI